MARARGRRPRGRPLRPAGGHTGRGASRLDALHVNGRRQIAPKRFLPSNSGDWIRFVPDISPEILAGCSSDSGPGKQEESKGSIGRRATRWGQIGTRER